MTECLDARGQRLEVDLHSDRGFLLGDGVFETVRVEGGVPLWLEEHLQRLGESARRVRLVSPWTPSQVAGFLRGQLGPWPMGRLRLSLTAGAGGRGYIRPTRPEVRLYAHVTEAAPAVRLERLDVSPHRVPESWPAKTLSGLPRILTAPPEGKEWVMLSEKGHVTETTMANIFWLREGEVQTPRRNASMLGGLTRDRVLKLAKAMGLSCREGDFELDVLRGAAAIWLTGTVIGLLPVERIEDRLMGENAVYSMIFKEYQQVIHHEIQRVKSSLFR